MARKKYALMNTIQRGKYSTLMQKLISEIGGTVKCFAFFYEMPLEPGI